MLLTYYVLLIAAYCLPAKYYVLRAAAHVGALYLSQTARMAFALTKASSKSDLLGATVINSLLCLTSAGRIAGGVPANAVTLGLVAGQGAMAALSFVGFSKAV